MQARSADGAGEDSTQHGIAVVEQAVDIATVLVAGEVPPEQQLPIPPRRLGLDIVGIARTHRAGEEVEGAGLVTVAQEDFALHADFGLDDLLPHLLAQGAGRRELGPHAGALQMMAVQRPDD